jgi:GntR family transcriptional regulator
VSLKFKRIELKEFKMPKSSAKITAIKSANISAYKLDLKSSRPLYIQVTDLIKNQISQKFWQLDEMIPSENELAAAYEVSVGTVKKALSKLVDEGILYRRQGKGTFVNRPDFKRSFMRFFRYGVDDEQKGRFISSRVLNSDIITPAKRIRDILKLADNEKTITIKRIRYLKDLPLMLEDLYLPYKIFKGFDEIDISQELLYPIYDEKFKTPIIWADEYLRPTIADSSVAEALKIDPGDPVISIERIVYTYGDEPVEVRSSIGRGDKFRYHIEIR